MPDLRANIFSVMCAMSKRFNMTSDQETLKFKKIATTLVFEERSDHGNGDVYLVAMRLCASLCSARKLDLEGMNLERMTPKKLEDTVETTEKSAIKRKAKYKIKVKTDENESCERNYDTTTGPLSYKYGGANEEETDRNFTKINQKAHVKGAVAQDDKASGVDIKSKSIKITETGKDQHKQQ